MKVTWEAKDIKTLTPEVTVTLPDQVFRDPSVKGEDSFRVICDGRLIGADWNSYGAAQAGLEVEQRRVVARKLKEQK